MSRLTRNFALTVSGIGMYGLSAYSTYQLYKIYQAPEPAPNCHEPKNQSPYQNVYSALAPDYDSKIDWDEYLLGIGRRRNQLLEHAVVRMTTMQFELIFEAIWNKIGLDQLTLISIV